jgi:hypothetical protein
MSLVTRAHHPRGWSMVVQCASSWSTSLLLLGVCSLTSRVCVAQAPDVHLGLGLKLGASSYDLDGTGTAFVGGPTAFAQFGKLVIVELGVPVLDYSQDVDGFPGDASSRTRFLLPELSVRIQAPIGRVAPFLAAGGGGAIRLNGQARGGGTLHAGAGVRVRVSSVTRLHGEVRARSIRPWTGSAVDFTIGADFLR